MRTLVKFYQNFTETSTNRLVTRTLGKLGVVDRESLVTARTKPNPGDWWYCDIVQEVCAGADRGVFVLRPVEKLPVIEQDGFSTVDILHLVPGLYTSQRCQNVMLLHPRRPDRHWIASSDLRHHIVDRHMLPGGRYGINSVVVVFDGADDWPKKYS